MLVKVLFPIFALLLSDMVSGETIASRRQNLDNVAIVDRFRIFYSLSGIDALPPERRIDLNKNGTPDYIEKLARRFIHVDRFYREDVGLVSPLDSDRYRGHASYIDINLIDLARNKKGPKNGIAYDGTPKIDRSAASQKSVNVLLIDLSNALSWENRSVEHELFHLYQNGYTYFKNPWYTEGTARWSEYVMDGRIGAGGTLPRTKDQLHMLFGKKYDASSFWNELILRCDMADRGKNFIRHLLEALKELDSVAAEDRQMNTTNWKESEQRSKDNDPYIWRAVLKAMEAMEFPVSSDKEISALFQLSGG
ncbi:hypothetical protein [Microbulbifer pacificus]|uniref:hypothetical protein n=1 Tax=Microbulbifer pacificus TaxID=407164 RepID=UPI000CF3C5FB|nr:hypothetical protein [Microbulbifer pacificus]